MDAELRQVANGFDYKVRSFDKYDLGVLCRQNFLGFVTLPGEGRLPELRLSWEHYLAAPVPPGEIVDGVLCDTGADMVIRKFWVISPLHI